MTSNVILYWFSGTGNTLFVAKKLKDKIDSLGSICSIVPLEKSEHVNIQENTTVGLVVPVAMQGTFPLVWDFINHLPIVNNVPFFLVDTLGAYSGGIKGPIKRIVKKKGFVPIGAIEIVMPNLFLKKKEEENDKHKIEEAVKAISIFCEKLYDNRTTWSDIPVYSTLLSLIFNSQNKAQNLVKLFPKKVTNKCINCGICIQICPKKCIDQESKHIKEDSIECILCQRCLEYCPENAIEIKGHKFIKNNLISLQDMKSALGRII